MPVHACCRCWIHLVWTTKNRAALLGKAGAKQLSQHLMDCSQEHGIHMRTNYVNPEHVHSLIDLPSHLSIDQLVKLIKEDSQAWAIENISTKKPFAWGDGFGAFSVSHSRVSSVYRYISNQRRYHRAKSFEVELDEFVRNYGLKWSGGDILIAEEETPYGEHANHDTIYW